MGKIAWHAALILFSGLAVGTAQASIPLATQPELKAGDKWIYKSSVERLGHWRQTRDESSVERTEGDRVLMKVRAADSPEMPREQLVGSDWSRVRTVNGEEIVVNRPFAFPLEAGKSWKVEFSEDHPANRQFSVEQVRAVYHVIGHDRITVPAGTFDAIKVEGEGRWKATVAAGSTGAAVTHVDQQGSSVTLEQNRQPVGAQVGGRIYKAFWYVPNIKRAVKLVEEWYNGNGVRTESENAELESFSPAG